jgi:hypothetical protein
LTCQDEFFENGLLDVKENGEHASNFSIHFPLVELLLRRRVITLNPALFTSDNLGQEGCIVRGDLTKLLAVFDMLLLLISCRKSHQARYTTPKKRM